MTLDGLARLTALAEPVSIIAPGGMGKSTTVVQLAECMLEEDGQVPLLVPLGEWSDREDDFFDFILRRNAFGAFRRQHLMQLAYYGRLVLLLDGWNELTLEARLRATRDVKVMPDGPGRALTFIETALEARSADTLPDTGPTLIRAQCAADPVQVAREIRRAKIAADVRARIAVISCAHSNGKLAQRPVIRRRRVDWVKSTQAGSADPVCPRLKRIFCAQTRSCPRRPDSR